ncbi:Peroxidasin [Schistosoma japonicum]|nr:Peroxidasin [Schistosoma japonicum]
MYSIIFYGILLSIQSTLIITEECPRRCVCMGQTIRCQNVGFRTIPQLPNIVPSPDGGVLEYLTVVENSILRLEKASFEGHLDLLRLELYSNQIVWISVEAFIGLPMLKVLVLRSNRLAYLPQDVFTPVYTLEELDLSNNQLKHLPFSIEGLIYLKRLSLGDNQIHCPCELVDFSLSLMYVESKSSRVTCYSPPQVRNIRLSDLADRLRTLVNQTRLLGYQALSDPERNKKMYSESYQRPYGYWPWPHCPRKDFGGMTPKLLTASDKDYDTHDPTSNNVINNSPTQDNVVYSENRAPTLAVQLKNVKVVAGEVARFICRSEPDVVSQITWILPVKATRYIRLYRRRQILEITEAHDYHEGSYICVLSNSYGVVTSEGILQLVQPTKPTIIEAPPADDNAVAEHSILDLRCTAKGLPKPYISWVWQKETLPLQLVTGGRYIVRSHSTEINSLQFQFQNNLSIYATDKYILAENEKTETMSILLIRNVTTEDAHGRYTCYVANRLGSARVSTVIRVLTDKSHQVASVSEIQDNETTENEEINYKSSNIKSDDGDDLVKEIIEKARKRIETAIRKTADRLRDTGRRRSSADIASLFRQPNRAALELAKAAEVYEAAIDEVTSILRQRNQKHFEFNKTETIPDEFKEHDEIDPNSHDTYGVELNTDQLAIIAQLSGCQSSQQVDPCSRQLCFHLRYRSIDGTCNNLNHPRWGAALVPFRRLLPPKYENGMNTPIGWSSTKLYFGYPKPSARLVSRELLGNASLMVELSKIVEAHNKQMKMKKVHENSTISTSINKNEMYSMNLNNANDQITDNSYVDKKLFDEDDKFSGMLMQWGQFLDHDLDFTPVDASTSRFSDGLGCNETCVNDPPCFPILVPPNDPRIKHRCIGFARSSATCGSGSTSILLGKPRYREQLNQITAFIDASNVYGSDDFENSQLRETLFDEGKMREGMPTEAGKFLLPFNIRGQVDCQADPRQDFVPCFKAGDHRSNENLGLLSLHTLWLREHNRLADGLRTLNPHWSGDRIFHEVRKIVGASMQAITYRSWLPIVLGNDGMKLLGTYDGYDDQINPTISNEFATAAMRFGHTMVPPVVFRLNENWETIDQGHLLLHQAFFAPDRLLKDGGMDPILRGLLFNGIRDRTRSPSLNSELTERLFAMAHELALDLAALNVQRGRDHGLPGYTEYAYKVCGLGSSAYPNSFNELKPRITKPHILEGLRRVYGHPGNIDLFTGGILEDLLPDARVGPTFACIIAEQFRKLRSGDRFWYEAPGVFSSAQLAEIKRTGSSLSRIICENSDNITKVPENAFIRPNRKQDLIDCNRISRLNLAVWKECPFTSGFLSAHHGTAYITDIGKLEPTESLLLRRNRRDTTITENISTEILNNHNTTEQLARLSKRIKQLEDQLFILLKK